MIHFTGTAGRTTIRFITIPIIILHGTDHHGHLHGIGDTAGTAHGIDGDIAPTTAGVGDGIVLTITEDIMVDTTTITGEEIITITIGLIETEITIVTEEEPQQVLQEVVMFQEV